MRIPPPNRRRGSAVIIMLALLTLLLVLMNANTNNVRNLNRELHRLDEQQTKRWQTLPLNRWGNPPLTSTSAKAMGDGPPGRGTSGPDASNIRLPSSEGMGVGSGESLKIVREFGLSWNYEVETAPHPTHEPVVGAPSIARLGAVVAPLAEQCSALRFRGTNREPWRLVRTP